MPYIPPIPRAPQVICDTCGTENLTRFIAKTANAQAADDLTVATIICQTCVLSLPAAQAIALINGLLTPMNALRFDDEDRDLREWLEVIKWNRSNASDAAPTSSADIRVPPFMEQSATYSECSLPTHWSALPLPPDPQNTSRRGLHRSAKH
jgi:hypothetical protein